jgi:hypothetical protein
MKMKLLKSLTLGFLAAAALMAVTARAADPTGVPGIAGSRHDFTSNTNFWIAGATNTWVSRNNMCGVCHTVHHNNEDKLAPLWHHTSTTTEFTPYTSSTLNASVGNPGGSSRACLSCHDGSVAVNSIDGVVVGGTELKVTDETGRIGGGGDLSTSHPIGFTYDDALAAADGELHPPSSTTVFGSGGKTIKTFMLPGDKMECSSCHDIHRQKGNSMRSGIYGKVGGSGARPSELCLTCHKK